MTLMRRQISVIFSVILSALLCSCSTYTPPPYNYDVDFERHKQFPLHHVAITGETSLQRSVVRETIEGSANVNERDSKHFTPLHYAAMHGKTRAIIILLENGADADARTLSGDTPGMLAKKNGNIEAMNLIYLAGGDADADASAMQQQREKEQEKALQAYEETQEQDLKNWTAIFQVWGEIIRLQLAQ